MRIKSFRAAAIAAVATAALAAPAFADHSWSTYHWQKGTGPLRVDVGDNVDSKWDRYLEEAMNGGPYTNPPGGDGQGWNATAHIDSPIVAGRSNPKNCKAVSGTIQVCNSRYGQTGWLGIAQIWLSGGHIVQGITKLNDTYFDTAKYNTPAWRRLVMCQEVGHDYGLGHTNEIFDNYNDGTCMDYTNAPSGGMLGTKDYGPSNEYINQHDHDQLNAIYSHSHSNFTAVGPGRSGSAVGRPPHELDGAIGGDSPAEWGRAVATDGRGRPHIFVQDLGNGNRKITHVFWTLEHRGGGHHNHDH